MKMHDTGTAWMFDATLVTDRSDLPSGTREARPGGASTERAGRIALPSAPVRRGPSPDAELDTEALMGEALTVLDEQDGYARVRLSTDGYVGYVPAAAIGETGAVPTHRVASLRTFLYPAPALKRPPLAFLSFGVTLAVTGQAENGYVPVATGGYVTANHLVALGDRQADFVEVAARFDRTPYLWGGKTSLGIDCSGLVQVSLAACGYASPRDSWDQAAHLGELIDVPPDLSGLQRGDLVFWKGHVGIMCDGERLLHANAHHMEVATEPLAGAVARILAKGAGPVTAIRRIPDAPLG